MTRVLAMACCLCCALKAGGEEAVPAEQTASGERAGSGTSAAATAFSPFVLDALAKMPQGGGYAVNRAAAEALCRRGVVWSEKTQRLLVAPGKAQPSFCSSACYLALLIALQEWEKRENRSLPPDFWRYARAEVGQPDGARAWGRVNANGPGLAKWATDLGAGVNFTDPALALPGDFLKIFWTREIGKREFGHCVVFLGRETTRDGPAIRFWSSNKPKGYGSKTVPLSRISRMIFTRITHPERFADAAKLPDDTMLADMQKKSFSFDEVRRACGIDASKIETKPTAAPEPKTAEPDSPKDRD